MMLHLLELFSIHKSNHKFRTLTIDNQILFNNSNRLFLIQNGMNNNHNNNNNLNHNTISSNREYNHSLRINLNSKVNLLLAADKEVSLILDKITLLKI